MRPRQAAFVLGDGVRKILSQTDPPTLLNNELTAGAKMISPAMARTATRAIMSPYSTRPCACSRRLMANDSASLLVAPVAQGDASRDTARPRIYPYMTQANDDNFQMVRRNRSTYRLRPPTGCAVRRTEVDAICGGSRQLHVRLDRTSRSVPGKDN